MNKKTPSPSRPFAVLYFGDARHRKPSTQGFTKDLANAKVAAVRNVFRGFVTRVEIRDRTSGRMLFETSKRLLDTAFVKEAQ